MKKQIEKPARSRSSAERRGALLPVSEQMQHWSAMLQGELELLPGVSEKSMFGLRSFYRRQVIFAALPGSRAFDSGSSILFKFNSMPGALFKKAREDGRIRTKMRIPGKGWLWFELSSEADLRDALWWLYQAYQAAKGGNRKKASGPSGAQPSREPEGCRL